eukprot:12426154-Karenia_brevis.AAC.1
MDSRVAVRDSRFRSLGFALRILGSNGQPRHTPWSFMATPHGLPFTSHHSPPSLAIHADDCDKDDEDDDDDDDGA